MKDDIKYDRDAANRIKFRAEQESAKRRLEIEPQLNRIRFLVWVGVAIAVGAIAILLAHT